MGAKRANSLVLLDLSNNRFLSLLLISHFLINDTYQINPGKNYVLLVPWKVVGRNVSILLRTKYVDKTSGVQQSLETLYQPCSKDRKDVFLTKDGPLFKLKVGFYHINNIK